MRKAVPGVLAIGTLVFATLLTGVLSAVPALAQSSASASTEVPTMAPLPTIAVPSDGALPCAPSPVPTEAAATELPAASLAPGETAAAPSEAATSASPSLESPVPCESPAAPSESPSASDAASGFCALLTPAEIQAVVGATVMAGSPDSTSCGWVSVDAGTQVLLLVQDLALSDFDQLKGMNLPGVETTAVSGIGDAAFVQTLGGAATSLYVKQGDRGIQIMLVSPMLSQDQVTQQEEALAQILVGRI